MTDRTKRLEFAVSKATYKELLRLQNRLGTTSISETLRRLLEQGIMATQLETKVTLATYETVAKLEYLYEQSLLQRGEQGKNIVEQARKAAKQRVCDLQQEGRGHGR